MSRVPGMTEPQAYMARHQRRHSRLAKQRRRPGEGATVGARRLALARQKFLRKAQT